MCAVSRHFSTDQLARLVNNLGGDAAWAAERMRTVTVSLESDELKAQMRTTFLTSGSAADGHTRVLFLHGADSSCLEWRSVLRTLSSEPLLCTALDWWSGGWTDRAPITVALQAQPTPPRPWTLIRQHIHAFWEQQMDRQPLVLVGTSLGGAVALDFAAAHPEAVSELVLLDAGGQSFKAPPPDVVTALAPAVVTVKAAAAWVQARVPSGAARLASLHRGEPGWRDAYSEYARSGGYARHVRRELICSVRQPTLVVWGEDDDILPVEDAFSFEDDLQQCVGVTILPGVGHTPQLEAPEAVAASVAQFVRRGRTGHT